MFTSGYFIVPRSITTDHRYKTARLKYQKVLLVLLENAAFSDTTQSNGPNIIQVKKGQYYTAIRQLAKLCNEDVGHKEDLIDKNIIVRALEYFTTCQFVRHEQIQGKTMITITIPDIYNQNKCLTETTIDTKPRQDRDTKEEYKKNDDVFDIDMNDARGKNLLDENKEKGWTMKNMKGEEIILDESIIYSAMLAHNFPTDVIQEAIDKAKTMEGPFTCMTRYIETICRKKIKQKQALELAKTKKTKPIKIDSAPPKITEKGISLKHFMDKINHDKSKSQFTHC